MFVSLSSIQTNSLLYIFIQILFIIFPPSSLRAHLKKKQNSGFAS
ncbi:hypothetical protein Nmel_007342 [Mimus melanotis]